MRTGCKYTIIYLLQWIKWNSVRTYQYINMSHPTSQQHSSGEAKLSAVNRRVDSADIRCFAQPYRVRKRLWSDMRVTYTNTAKRRQGLALVHLTLLQKEAWELGRGLAGGGVTVTAQPSTLQASFNTNRASPGSGRQAGQIEGQWLISLPC